MPQDPPGGTPSLWTVKALREALEGLPDDTPVVLANSPEGNGYSPVAAVEECLYHADSKYAGSWYATDEMRATEGAPEDWEEAPQGSVPAVFLWPAS
jgi:hypothetical protein